MRGTRIALLLAMLVSLVLAAPAHAAYAPLARPGPALEVPRAQLDAALKCTAGIAGATRSPVLLSPATGVTADQNYSWNYERSLSARGIPWCQVTMPQRTLGDIQVAAEYLVQSIRTMHARSGRRIAIIGHSQGGMSMRWALRFWPDTRSMVDDVIGFAGSNHGTEAGGPGLCSNGCTPASWQQGAKSNFIAALNSLTESFGGISYTEVYTHTDEVVTPNQDDSGSSSLRTGGGRITNVATQDICPADMQEHLQIGTSDPVAYALAMDALDHDGPASEARIDRAVCAQLYQPGVDPANAQTYLQILAGVPGLLAVASPVNVVGVPTPRSEPPLRCYVFAECTRAGSDAAGRCVSATARARGRVYGPAALGRTRKAQRRRLPGRRVKRRKGIDRFCVTGGGALEIGYPTARISRAGRRAAKGRAILVLASTRRFSVRRITRGTRTSSLRRRLKGERRYRVGRNTWYVAPGKRATLVFRTRRGRVGATGIASKRLTRGSKATRRLLRAWDLRG